MNHEISYAVRGSRLGLLILFVCLLLIGSTAPTFAAQYSFSVPLPHKEKYMSNPAGDEDPFNELDSPAPDSGLSERRFTGLSRFNWTLFGILGRSYYSIDFAHRILRNSRPSTMTTGGSTQAGTQSRD